MGCNNGDGGGFFRGKAVSWKVDRNTKSVIPKYIYIYIHIYVTQNVHQDVFACGRDGSTLFYLVYFSGEAITQTLLTYLKVISPNLFLNRCLFSWSQLKLIWPANRCFLVEDDVGEETIAQTSTAEQSGPL